MAHFRAMADRSNFLRLSELVVALAGHRHVLVGASLVTASWCFVGALLHLPQEWFLLTNMVGTMMTLFLLLLMQHSQNRDMRAVQAKVDELIRSSDNARNHLIGAEQREAHEIEQMIKNSQADA
jgi:low affinity Fe/Cu permease